MATTNLTNSGHKVRAASIPSVVDHVPEQGAVVFDLTDNKLKIGNGSSWTAVDGVPYSDTYWVDMLGPATAARLDSASGRLDFNYFNGAIGFQSNARYPNEPVVWRMQIQHYFKLLTNGRPHFHWKQQSSDVPNWLFGWKLSRNGQVDIIETDWTNYDLSVIDSHAFTYTSGVLDQISVFPEIDLSNANISDLLTCVLWRDSANTSTLFAGADPSSLEELVTDLDVHIQVDAPGSDLEYVK